MVTFLQVIGALVLGGALLQAGASLFRVARHNALVKQREELALEGFIERAKSAVGRPGGGRRSNKVRGWTGVRKFYIDRKVMEARNVCSFYLRPHDGKPLPPYVPGQYLTVEVAMPGEPRPLVRCYSLSEAPGSREYYRLTIKALPGGKDAPPGKVSNHLHSMPEGSTLNVRAPNGQFFLDIRRNRPVVLIAGGIGITPALSMLNMICNFGLKREVYLFYGVRNRAEHAMYEHLKRMQRKYRNLHVVTCYSDPTPTCEKGRDFDHRGRVTVPLMRFLIPLKGCEFYMCGPAAMMKSMHDGLRDSGVPEPDIRMEAFGPASLESAPLPVPAGKPGQKGPSISFARSGKSFDWSPTSRSLLDIAEANGVSMNSGCRAGQCGSCAVGIKEGKVKYLSEPGAPPPAGQCLACIAVPETDLVLDA